MNDERRVATQGTSALKRCPLGMIVECCCVQWEHFYSHWLVVEMADALDANWVGKRRNKHPQRLTPMTETA